MPPLANRGKGSLGLIGRLLGTVITQCSIRQLYTLSEIPAPQKEAFITLAKTMERRRCNHHTLENPLSTLECLSSVIDPKNSGVNRAHVVVASQEEEVRRWCRGIRGVPLVYVKRSVMIMEPMAESSVNVREGIEQGKFRTGLRGRVSGMGAKRKREDEGSGAEGREAKVAGDEEEAEERPTKKKKVRGPKGPNPLSMKKPKKEKVDDNDLREQNNASLKSKPISSNDRHATQESDTNIIEGPLDEAQNPPAKRKRKRKQRTDKAKDFGKELEMEEREGSAGS